MEYKIYKILFPNQVIHNECSLMLDYHVKGSSPKGLAKEIGLAILTRLVVPRPNL